MVSSGILFSFLFLVVVGVVYVIALLYAGQQTSKNATLKETQKSNQAKIDEALQGEPAAFIAKSRALGSERYTDDTTSTILREFHQMIIPGIVFESFGHTVDPETRLASLSLTANTISLDTLAAQIQIWKNNPLFSQVRTGGAVVDEETGFLSFDASFVLSQDTSTSQNEATSEQVVEPL